MSPYESSANSYAEIELGALLRTSARRAGYLLCGTVNVAFTPRRWIQPDLAVMRDLPEPDVDIFVHPDHVVMPVEMVSPSSRKRDRIDKPALCAGIPYCVEAEVRRRDDRAEVKLFELQGERYVEIAAARAGARFETERPFPLSFDPAELLPPRSS